MTYDLIILTFLLFEIGLADKKKNHDLMLQEIILFYFTILQEIV
jgi:hypothetical protein